jgi:hypothetical protein
VLAKDIDRLVVGIPVLANLALEFFPAERVERDMNRSLGVDSFVFLVGADVDKDEALAGVKKGRKLRRGNGGYACHETFSVIPITGETFENHSKSSAVRRLVSAQAGANAVRKFVVRRKCPAEVANGAFDVVVEKGAVFRFVESQCGAWADRGAGYGGGMEIEFDGARHGGSERTKDTGGVHRSAGAESEHAVVGRDPELAAPSPHTPEGKNHRERGGGGEASAGSGNAPAHAAGFVGEAQAAKAVVTSDAHEIFEHQRVGMKMLVAVGVGDTKTRAAAGLELGADFASDFASERGVGCEAEGHRCHRAPKAPLCIDEAREIGGPEKRKTVREDDVKADRELGKTAGAGEGVGRRGGPDHEARGCEDALAVGAFHGLVDFGCRSEVVGRNDEDLA